MPSKQDGYFVTTVKTKTELWKSFRIVCVQLGIPYQKGFERALTFWIANNKVSEITYKNE